MGKRATDGQLQYMEEIAKKARYAARFLFDAPKETKKLAIYKKWENCIWDAICALEDFTDGSMPAFEHKKRRATLVAIGEDGRQKYRTENNDVEWLCGIDRAKNVEVGDRGYLVYNSSPTRGGFRFEKDNQ